MSTTKTLNDRAEEKKEFHKKQQELIESDEFEKMLVDYEHWSKHLPILKAQIESVLGPLLEEQSVHSETVIPEKKGNTNRPTKPAADVLKEMVDLLKNHPEGMRSKEIAELLNVGLPKIAEAISLNEALFEKREKGPKSVIKLKV
jgi:hypothetical protein